MYTRFLKHFQYIVVNQWLEPFSMLNTSNMVKSKMYIFPTHPFSNYSIPNIHNKCGNMWEGESTLWGVNLGTFTTCITNVHLQNVLCLILGLILLFGLYILIFTKFMLFNIIWKKRNKFKRLSWRNNWYIYGNKT